MAKKTHNWTTSGNTVDRAIEKTATRFIESCGHLTPQRVEELDNLIGVSQAVRDHNAGKTLIKPGREKETDQDRLRSAEVLESMKDHGDWMDNAKPTKAELQVIETE